MTTNEERFRTKEERSAAFLRFCKKNNGCKNCPLSSNKSRCSFVWLTLEAEEEKPMPCPFCGGEVEVSPLFHLKRFAVMCNNNRCDVRPCTKYEKDINKAIAVWNRRAK